MQYLIGIDIGATNTRVAVVDSMGKIIATTRFPSEMSAGESFFQKVGEAAAKLASEYQAIAVGVGSAGQIDRKTGSYLPGLYPTAPWVGVPLREIIATTTTLPTFVDNDCKISAYAELKIGQGQGVADFVSLTLGTGLGGGIISNGQLVHGISGVAGHVGHLSLDHSGPQCACGNRGCLELYVSGTAVAKQGSLVFQEELTSPQVFQRASEGDTRALQILHEVGTALGQGLGAMANLLNPQLFILGGSILEWYPFLESSVQASFRATAMNGLQDTPIKRSQLGGEGGIIGAALYAWDQL